jgi:hypothetical protein
MTHEEREAASRPVNLDSLIDELTELAPRRTPDLEAAEEPAKANDRGTTGARPSRQGAAFTERHFEN